MLYETWLIPYLEDTLDAERRAELEARLADDPALRAERDALQRAEPRLRAIAARQRPPEAARPSDVPLWPALRGELGARPAWPVSGPAVWWTGAGLCAAGLLAYAVLSGPVLHPQERDRRPAWRRGRLPLVVSYPDNGAGTAAAKRLRARAAQVAAERRAAASPGPT